MVDAMSSPLFLMDGDNCLANIVGGNDVDAVVRAQWKYRQPRQDVKSLHHIELGGLGSPAITHNDRWAKNGTGYVWQKLGDHVLTKLFCARVRIVVGAIPVDGGIFPH